MGFVANSTSTNPAELSVDPNWPPISLTAIRGDIRIDGSVTDARLRQLVLEEMIDVIRLVKAAAGYDAARLREPVLTLHHPDVLFFSAVSNGVAAKTCEKYRNYDSTNTGNKRADEQSSMIDDYRRNKHWAIQQMVGRTHTVVDLI